MHETFEQFVVEFEEYKRNHKRMRKGQSLMNFLWESGYNDIYDTITGTEIDCFNDERKTDECLDYIASIWE